MKILINLGIKKNRLTPEEQTKNGRELIRDWASTSFKVSLTVIRFYLFFILVCSILFLFEIIYPSLLNLLALKSANVWGFFTYVFVHESFDHLFGNVFFLFFYMLGFVLILFINDYNDAKKLA